MTSATNPVNASDNLQQLIGFLKQHVPAAGPMSIAEDTALLGTGLLDSLAVVQLMLFLSSQFGIEIEDDDFTPENLADVGSLLKLIARKQAAPA